MRKTKRRTVDPNFVMIDLAFDTQGEAEGLLAVIRGVWAGPGKDVMRNPQARIVDTGEHEDL